MAKASLIELDSTYEVKNGGKTVEVQFNPETLKVSYANQLNQPSSPGSNSSGSAATGAGTAGAGDQANQAGQQFVGAGTTKLALQLWFDISVRDKAAAQVVDVRDLTQAVAFFITPQPEGEHFVPPVVRFQWGTFNFDGIMDSLEESLEFFSDDGRPLRASVSVSISQQKISEFNRLNNKGAYTPPGVRLPGGGAPGTQPLVQAPAGSTLQDLAASAGQASNWQAIAESNDIDNPRLLQPGQVIRMNNNTRR